MCKRTQGFSFYPIDCSNDRISVIKVKSGSRVSVTLIGVYMPYHNGSAAQVESYVETLAELRLLEVIAGLCCTLTSFGHFKGLMQ